MSHLTVAPPPPPTLELAEVMRPVAELLTERLALLSPDDEEYERMRRLCRALRRVAKLPPVARVDDR